MNNSEVSATADAFSTTGYMTSELKLSLQCRIAFMFSPLSCSNSDISSKRETKAVSMAGVILGDTKSTSPVDMLK